MAASNADLARWYDEGVELGASHMIVVCDSFDWEDYPVYITEDKDLQEEIKAHDNVNMQRIMEVYNFSMDRDEQLTPGKCVYNL